jgi:hypothetical protein
LLLFDRGLDEVGHGTGYELIGHFEELLKDIERAIRRLRTWGYTEIEIVTDHGFVLLPSSANVQLYQVDKGRFAWLTDRSGFLPRGEPAPVATVPFALDPNWSVALAPGLRSFAAPGTFFHGGATLQEVVVPHLKITSPVAARPRLRARAVVPQVDIATLSVRVELAPERPARANLFEGEPEAIRVRVFLGTPTEPRSPEKIVTLTPDDAGSKSVTLFLQRDPPIMAGTEIAVQAFDADTDEAYATGLFVRAVRDLD